jgi:hypothetical protein
MPRRPPPILLTVLLLACCQAHQGDSAEDRETLLECRSPDGSLATYYVASGGGAAGWAYEHVSVTPIGESTPSDVLALKDAYDVHLVWENATTLKIQVPQEVRIDHWQSWFGRSAQGTVRLEQFPSGPNAQRPDSGSCAPAA